MRYFDSAAQELVSQACEIAHRRGDPQVATVHLFVAARRAGKVSWPLEHDLQAEERFLQHRGADLKEDLQFADDFSKLLQRADKGSSEALVSEEFLVESLDADRARNGVYLLLGTLRPTLRGMLTPDVLDRLRHRGIDLDRLLGAAGTIELSTPALHDPHFWTSQVGQQLRERLGTDARSTPATFALLAGIAPDSEAGQKLAAAGLTRQRAIECLLDSV